MSSVDDHNVHNSQSGPDTSLGTSVPRPLGTRNTAGSRPASVSGYQAPFFPSAAQPEIIRANQKDLYYLAQLTDQAEEVLRGIFGTRWLQTFANEVSLGSKLAYYGLTTWLGTQTLGEEYVDILQYDSKTRKIPGLVSRSLLVVSHVLAPYALAGLYNRLRRYLVQRRSASAPAHDAVDEHVLNEMEPLFADEEPHAASGQALTASPSGPPAGSSRLPLASLLTNADLPPLESIVDEHLAALHLAVFYLFGRYYHVAKRFLRVRYLSLQSRGEGQAKPPSYEVLGAMMGVQLTIRLVSHYYKRRKQARLQAEAEREAALKEKEGEEDVSVPALATIDGVPVTSLTFDPDDPTPNDEDPAEETTQARRCTLCLGPRRDPAATECGHCFCYECIVGWTREKAECPLCRQKVNVSRILPLYNL